MNNKKVFVSGCYDLLHGGHIAFFKTASAYGDLYVSIGRDENIFLLKGKRPVFSEEERLFIVRSVRYVHQAFLGSGTGMLSFMPFPPDSLKKWGRGSMLEYSNNNSHPRINPSCLVL